MVAVSMDKHL
jgi:hypothetical protein